MTVKRTINYVKNGGHLTQCGNLFEILLKLSKSNRQCHKHAEHLFKIITLVQNAKTGRHTHTLHCFGCNFSKMDACFTKICAGSVKRVVHSDTKRKGEGMKKTTWTQMEYTQTYNMDSNWMSRWSCHWCLRPHSLNRSHFRR